MYTVIQTNGCSGTCVTITHFMSPLCRPTKFQRTTWRTCAACSCVAPGGNGTTCKQTRSSRLSSPRSSSVASAATCPTRRSASSHGRTSFRLRSRCRSGRRARYPSPISDTCSARRRHYQRSVRDRGSVLQCSRWQHRFLNWRRRLRFASRK